MEPKSPRLKSTLVHGDFGLNARPNNLDAGLIGFRCNQVADDFLRFGFRVYRV